MSHAPQSHARTSRGQRGALARSAGSASGFLALLGQVADIEKMIVAGLTDDMPCKKKHIYREQAFRQAISLATTYFKQNNQVTDAKRSA